MRIIIETYDYGIKCADSYKDMYDFRVDVFISKGYVVTCDNMIIDSENIKVAYPEINLVKLLLM